MTKEQKILLVFVLAIAGGGATFYVSQEKPVSAEVLQGASLQHGKTSQTENTNTTGAQAIVVTTATASGTTEISAVTENKTLTESILYTVPENHRDEIKVVVTVDQEGKILDVDFSYSTPSNKESQEYLAKFDATFNPSLVVGKKLNEVKLSRVGGASLTTAAFNQAIRNMSTTFNG
jgi:hypothetical protein